MPAAIRSLLVQHAAVRSLYLPRRLLSFTSTTSSPRRHGTSNSPTRTSSTTISSSASSAQPPASYPPPPTPLSPPQSSPPLSFLPPPSNAPLPPIPGSPVPPPLLTRATTILTTPPPRFLYSAPRFLNLPLNLRCPEICLLGRSNVGKSTLINALAGILSSSAGRSHGSSVSSAKRKASVPGSGPKDLAITSAKAGCTKTLNGYAFGLPPLPKKSLSHNKEALSEKAKGAAGSGGQQGKAATGTRSERRDAAAKHRDTTPDAAMVLMDMPGYGQNSRREWGAEIAKYLSRRRMLRGAVVLVDAVAGVKDGDRAVLRLLRDADVRTAVVLTKADKLGYGTAGGGTSKGVAEVGRVCEGVWSLLRELEGESLTWTEGNGWEREIWVTGAGDPRNGGMGVEGVRFAIARMAGLVVDEREGAMDVRTPVAQRIVPFEELQWSNAGESGRFEVRA